MEPYYRNIISGEDDNVESLTDNADGNDVGMEFYSSRERVDNPPPKSFDMVKTYSGPQIRL